LDSNGGHGLDPKHDSDPSSGSRIRAATPDRSTFPDHAPRVLVVADEPDSASALAEAIAELRCEVTGIAEDPAQALLLARQRRPDLVIIDLQRNTDGDPLAVARALAIELALPAVLVGDAPSLTSFRLEPDTRSITPLTRPLSLQALWGALEGALLRRALKLRSFERDWYELAFNALPEAVLVCDGDRIVRSMNQVAELMTGSTRSDALGAPLRKVLAPLAFEEADDGLSSTLDHCLATGMSATLRLSVKPSGAFPASTLSSRLLPISRGSERIGVVLAFSDATLERKLDEQLASTDRLDALGALVAGLAHEVNNPLTVNLVNLELASFRVTELARSDRVSSSEVGRLAAVLREARLGAERIDQLVRELKAYARSEQNASRAVDLRGCARWALRFAGSRLEHSAKLTLKLDDTPLVLGNELKLSRVLIHLLVNATQAIQSVRGEAEVRLTTRTGEDGCAVVEVFDTGPAIPDELRDKIFDPFFAGHPGGPGAGLGLRISREIVEGLGGTLSFESGPESGTTFRVTLPSTVSIETESPVELEQRPSGLERGYPALVESSERMAWKVSEVFSKDARVDFSLPHFPEAADLVVELAFLTESERLKLNQLRSLAHVNVLGLFAEVSVAERLRHAGSDCSADLSRVRALLRSSEEGLKHQRLFSFYTATFERDFGSPCRTVRNAADVANVLLSHSPFAVVLASLHFTLSTQRHYGRCAQARLDPLVESMLHHQFVEATQHADIDRLELKRAAAGLARVELECALAEYASILDTVDDLLIHEAELSLANLACALERELVAEERALVLASEHRVHRRVFLVTPLADASFRDAVTGLLPEAASVLDRLIAKYDAPPDPSPNPHG
jgi:signal transduction histidine kinase